MPPHLRVLPVRGREEDHRRGQGDPEDPQAAEDEGAEGDQDPAAGSVRTAAVHGGDLKVKKQKIKRKNKVCGLFGGLQGGEQLCEACVTIWV